MDKYVNELFCSEQINEILKINDGWSNDIKLKVILKSGTKYLIRFSNIKFYKDNLVRYEHIKMIDSPIVTKVLKIGKTSDDKYMYMTFDWLDGMDLRDEILTLSHKEQYELGIDAGNTLKHIHSIDSNIPGKSNEKWASHYKKDLNNKINNYFEIEDQLPNKYKINEINLLIKIINKYKSLLNSRPVKFLHGDYHMGNMLIDNDGRLGIIDFNRSGFGDPYLEYDRFVFTWSLSPIFASGQLHGYFNGNPDIEFFQLLFLYNARNAISSIIWSLQFGNKELKVAKNNIDRLKNTYDNFSRLTPNWYIPLESLDI